MSALKTDVGTDPFSWAGRSWAVYARRAASERVVDRRWWTLLYLCSGIFGDIVTH